MYSKRITYSLFLIIFTLTLFQCKYPELIIDPPITIDSTKQVIPLTPIYPYKDWFDSSGKIINAHSAGILYDNGYYYWYGEDKILGSAENRGYTGAGMHCYRSKDLANWKDFGIVLPVDYNNASSDMAFGCIFQRPKVVFNKSTQKYVAFYKLYLKGSSYDYCYTGVATATAPTGPFTYDHKFFAASTVNGSGDFALYQDTVTGDLYHICVRKSDRVVVKAKMTSDYMNPATTYTAMTGVQNSTEGLAITYYKGVFHLLGSGSSGWDPNAARYYTSTSINGPWSSKGNPCKGINSYNTIDYTKTFEGQSTFILKIQGAENQFIAMFDVWRPTDPITSPYIWLPFKITNNLLTINWIDKWDMDWYKTH